MMKKWTVLLGALLLVSIAATAFASVMVLPDTYGMLKTWISGKSFDARISGWKLSGEGGDRQATLYVTACAEDLFVPEEVDSLQPGDQLVFGDGSRITVASLSADEFGVMAEADSGDVYSFYRLENGFYVAHTETDHPFYTDIFTVEVPLEKDVRFLDWSDLENLEGPVERGLDELVSLLQEGTTFMPYNTRVTFDENGKLSEFLYNYSPWN